MRLIARIRKLRATDWLSLAMLLLYVVIFSTLMIRQHEAFNTNALDLAKFDQSIWNTAQGRPFQITIGENLVLDSHFSPTLALYAPLFWIWSDIRILFVAQSVLLGTAGFLIYWYFRQQAPWLGLIVFGAYLMHPTLHQVNLIEFRRNTLAVFGISFALYHLLGRRYGWMALGLALALLSREDMSLLAIAFGLFILVVQRERWVGLVTLLTGLVWFIAVPFAVLPALMSDAQYPGYQHAARSYTYLGSTLPEIARTLMENPLLLPQQMGQPERLTAVFNFLWPSAFLFILAPEVFLLLTPYLGLLLASNADRMWRLGGWYPGVLVLILYWAVAVGITRLSRNWRPPALALLLAASATGWFLDSPLWPGSRFDPSAYEVTRQDRLVAEILADIPVSAVVMAQDTLVPHLSHRQQIYLLPWARGGNRPDYVAMDRALRTYPLGAEEYRSFFYDYLAGRGYAIDQQVDDFFVFKYVGEVMPQQEIDLCWSDSFCLEGMSVTGASEEGVYADQVQEAHSLRVALFWDVRQAMDTNYSVFVHALSTDGRLLGQHDSWPADAHRPTSALQAGERVRDVHYVMLSEPVDLSDLTLRIGLYDSASGEPWPDAEGRPFILVPAQS